MGGESIFFPLMNSKAVIAGLVEYCYEQAGEDIISDPPCFRNHEENTECTLTNVPLYRDRATTELVHRLYPGYLAKAFAEDVYPLDFLEMRQRSEKPEDFRSKAARGESRGWKVEKGGAPKEGKKS